MSQVPSGYRKVDQAWATNLLCRALSTPRPDRKDSTGNIKGKWVPCNHRFPNKAFEYAEKV